MQIAELQSQADKEKKFVRHVSARVRRHAVLLYPLQADERTKKTQNFFLRARYILFIFYFYKRYYQTLVLLSANLCKELRRMDLSGGQRGGQRADEGGCVRMKWLDREELAFMKERGITLCSTCRWSSGKTGPLCDMNMSMRVHSEHGSCTEYAKKGKTPEQQRIEAQKADEAQGRMFDNWGHEAR